MPKISDFRKFIVEWNNIFPLDREFRKKHNIAFNSPEHRAICQMDVYVNWLEDQMFEEHEVELVEYFKKQKLYEKGEWISERILSDKVEEELFDDIDITALPT